MAHSNGVSEDVDYVDVVVVGAGISGIAAAFHLQDRCPGRSVMILEGRERLGGTWDLFRYPGIRSDSDMHTLGFSFRPWKGEAAIADGTSIREYLEDTAKAYGIDERIRFQHRVKHASWSSEDASWTLDIERRVGDETESVQVRCGFLFMCCGYYDYAKGYTPDFPGIADYEGEVVHPQKWDESVEYAGKRIVVIGSGATAVTLLPNLAESAEHVTMLQRTPSYVMSAPARDKQAQWLRDKLPARMASDATRWKNVLLGFGFFNFSRTFPNVAADLIKRGVREQLGEEAVREHFTPPYGPWDQRVCLAPDGDFFKAVRDGRAEIVTDHIESFTPKGIRLKSGRELAADMVVTATGLNLQVMGGMSLTIDGEEKPSNEAISYKGAMFSGVPNLAMSFGYTNASWTLKCELIDEYVCRLLNHMNDNGYRMATPRAPQMETEPLVDFASGYFKRAMSILPRQGKKHPWRLHQNYFRDLKTFRVEAVDEPSLEFR